jgi:hypothetical protein
MEAETYAFREETSSIGDRLASARRRPTLRFGLHYLEMVAVMFAGMGVFAAGLALSGAVLGYGGAELETDAPSLFLAGMGFSMTAPMVWWMTFRGHSPAATRAMALSMIAPTVAVIVMLAVGLSTDSHALLMIQHTVMLPAMLVAMLPFRREYTHGH